LKKVLITGIEGFTGKYLAAELAGNGYEVHGITSSRTTPLANVTVCDICDAPALNAVVASVRPDAVCHLAAIAFVAHGDVDAIYRTNVIGTRNLLEALSRMNHSMQSILLASSANIYGNAAGGVLDEATPAAPANDYAVSKLAMEYMAKLYADRLPITIVRPFNYTGVGQSEGFLIPKIVSHVLRGESMIELGNLDVVRDFSDVRVLVSCYRRLLENHVVGGVFNVCSGRGYALTEILSMIAELTGQKLEVRVNPKFVRANEVKRLIGSRAALDQAIGSVDVIPLWTTLGWMLGDKARQTADAI
jgi:GDP-6-deoxy-D-talose 4-dehydrogenase